MAQAEHHLRELKRLKGGASATAVLERLLLRVEAGEVDELAPGLMTEAERGGPDAPAIYEAVTRAYCHELRFPQAWACLTRWLKKQPKSPRALEWRGWVAQNLNNADRALEDYARSLELQPERLTARLRVVSLFLDHNDPVEAEPHIKYLLRMGRPPTALLIHQARCRLLQGRLDDAATLLDNLLAKDAKNGTALLLRAEVEKGRKQPEKEEQYLRRAITLSHQQSTATLWAMSQCLLAQRKAREAGEYLRRHKELSAEITEMQGVLARDGSELPKDPDRCVKVAVTLFKIDQERGALNYLSKALRANPRHVRAHLLLADYFDRKKQPKQAELHRRKAKEKGPPPPESKPKR
jgi:Tfp pilus assembly protein PilF